VYGAAVSRPSIVVRTLPLPDEMRDMLKKRPRSSKEKTNQLATMRQRIAQLEALQEKQVRAEQWARQQAENLVAISELAIALASAPPGQDLWTLIGDSLKSITGALATGVTAYDPATKELVLEYLAADDRFLSVLNRHLGRHAIGFRTPVSAEMHRRMLTEVSRVAQDLTDTTFGAVPRPIAAAIESTLGIGHYAGLALHDAGVLMGTAVMVMPKDHPGLAPDLLRTFAHLTAISLRRKRAEVALRESEEQYRRLVETLPDGIVSMDMEANVLTANQEFLNLCGVENGEELLGKSALDLLVPGEEDRAITWFEKLLESRTLRDHEYQVRRKDGTTFPAEISASLVVDTHDQATGIIGVVRDITARKHMELEMEQRTRQLEALYRASQVLNSLSIDQVIVTALDGVRALLDVTAYSIWMVDADSGELVCRYTDGREGGIRQGWRLGVHEGFADWVVRHGQSLVVPDTHADVRFVREIEQATGIEVRSVLSVPLRVQQKVPGVLQLLDAEPERFTASDRMLVESLASSVAIALENAHLYEDLRARMEELQRAQVRLIESSKMAAVGELAAGVAHELNNPLTAILGFSELLLERSPSDEPDRPRLEAIARQARRIRDIVQNLLSFSRQTDFHLEPVDLNHVLQEALGLIRLRLKIAGIVIKEHYAEDLPPLLVDPGRMKQVFLNLITNALQAMPLGGTLTVSSELVGQEIAVHIADTGEGIPPEHQSRIFEPFFTTRSVGDGSGLGLPVSLGIVQDHGGRIQVESTEGQGSLFTVRLPTDGRTEGAFPLAHEQGSGPATETGTPPDHR
jgi:PAS domain S-box-containing protein